MKLTTKKFIGGFVTGSIFGGIITFVIFANMIISSLNK